MGKLLIVLGGILAVMGLLLMLALPVAGALAVLLGVFGVIYGKRYKPKKRDDEEIEIRSMEQFPVVGDYEQELKHFLTEKNEAYNNPDGKEYEYYTEWLTAELKDEPENEYDHNAIAVYIDDVKVGYIMRKDQERIRELKPEHIDIEIYGGRYKEAVYDYDDNKTIESGETPYRAMLHIESL